MAVSWLIACLGQSNMIGNGLVSGASAETLAQLEPTGFWYWSRGDLDVAWADGILIADDVADAVGPIHSLATALLAGLPSGDDLYIYNGAASGTTMAQAWDGIGSASSSMAGARPSVLDAYWNCIAAIPTTNKVVLGGIVFDHGYADATSTSTAANDYGNALVRFRRYWCGDLSTGHTQTPIVITQLPDNMTGTYRSTIQAKKVTFANTYSNVTLIPDNSWTMETGNIHLDADSCIDKGTLIAPAIVTYMNSVDTSGSVGKGSVVIRDAS